jgi:hypothetical protein
VPGVVGDEVPTEEWMEVVDELAEVMVDGVLSFIWAQLLRIFIL